MFFPFSAQAKSWEPVALALRKLGGAGPRNLLDPWLLAPKVGLRVIDSRAALKSLSLAERGHLLSAGRRSWSGGVYPNPLPDGTRICILNPAHSRRRNKITLMEEIVHVYRTHVPSGFKRLSEGVEVRDYNKHQEAEAYGIGAAALMPWANFFQAVNKGATVDELAEHYDVTRDLIEYRIKITGAYRLYRARQR